MRTFQIFRENLFSRMIKISLFKKKIFSIKKDIKRIRTRKKYLEKTNFSKQNMFFLSYQSEIASFIIKLQVKVIHHHFLHRIHQKYFHLHLRIPNLHHLHQRTEKYTYIVLFRTRYHQLLPTNHLLLRDQYHEMDLN